MIRMRTKKKRQARAGERILFARKIRVEYEVDGHNLPCPLKWLDSFSMRNFTNAGVFDDTLPVADGELEIGSNVPIDRLKEAMEDWFRRKGYLAKDSGLRLTTAVKPAS
jgi:hypothetical protein